ncbi:unnamed protein product [Urochloa humidicola]
MAAVANTAAAHGYQPWALAASSTNRGSSRARAAAAATATRALVRTGFAGAAGRPPPPRERAVTVRRAGAAGVRPSSSSPDAVTYRASISTNTPLHEPPGGEWRIQMLPLQFLLLTVRPVVVMQLRHRAGGLDLRVTDWELRGLDHDHAPSSFDLGVSGSLYADRSRGQRAGCRMRGHLEISITVVLPPPLRLVPESVLRGVTESVLTRLAEKMKRDVDVGLIADFQRFRREKAAAASRATPTLDESLKARPDL